jgi:hypothetical protein
MKEVRKCRLGFAKEEKRKTSWAVKLKLFSLPIENFLFCFAEKPKNKPI